MTGIQVVPLGLFPDEAPPRSRSRQVHEEGRVYRDSRPGRTPVSARRRPGQQQYRGPWYHGTGREFRPGTFAEPGHPPNFASRPEEYAYFTGSPEAAWQWANNVVAMPHREVLYPHVYEVEPAGPWQRDPEAEFPGQSGDQRSRHRLRVIREIAPDPAWEPAIGAGTVSPRRPGRPAPPADFPEPACLARPVAGARGPPSRRRRQPEDKDMPMRKTRNL